MGWKDYTLTPLIPLNEPIFFPFSVVGSFRGINGEIYKSSFV